MSDFQKPSTFLFVVLMGSNNDCLSAVSSASGHLLTDPKQSKFSDLPISYFDDVRFEVSPIIIHPNDLADWCLSSVVIGKPDGGTTEVGLTTW